MPYYIMYWSDGIPEQLIRHLRGRSDLLDYIYYSLYAVHGLRKIIPPRFYPTTETERVLIQSSSERILNKVMFLPEIHIFRIFENSGDIS